MKKMTEKKPWFERTFLWSQTNLTEADANGRNLDFWKTYWRDNQIEGVIINCSGIVTFYHSEKEEQKKSGFHGHEDCFGLWNQAAREAGLSVVARMDMNVTEKNMEDIHPDWYCRDRDNFLIMAQGRYVTCINGGYYRKWIPSVMKEVIERYHPDGFADNNWSGLRRDTICYCENCRRKFREWCGKELPKAHDWEDPVYRQWVRWGYETRVELWDFFNETVRRWGGDHCLWVGMLNADVIETRGQFYDIRALISRSRMIFLDNQSREEDGGFEENLIHGSLIHALTEKNMIAAESMGQYYRGKRAFRLSSAAAGEARLWSLTGISGGISPWYHFVGAEGLDRRKFHVGPDILRWYGENREWLTERKNKANIAILWNQETFIYYGQSDVRERCVYPWLGFARVLAQSGIPFIPVHTMDIDRYRNQIETYVIPDIAVMSREETETIMEEIEFGKNVVITGESGNFEVSGQRRKENPVFKMLKLEDRNRIMGCEEAGFGDWSWHKAHNYLNLSQETHPIFCRLRDTSILPFGGKIHVVESTGSLEKIAEYIPEIPIYPPEFSWISQKTRLGGVFAGHYKDDSRVVYLAADIDRCYGKYGILDHRKLLADAVLWASKEAPAARVLGDGEFCVSVYGKGVKILIHIVNLTGCRTMPGTLEKAVKVYDLKAEVLCEKEVSKVYSLVEERSYEFAMRDKKAVIHIPMLNEHEFLVLE